MNNISYLKPTKFQCSVCFTDRKIGVLACPELSGSICKRCLKQKIKKLSGLLKALEND